LHSRPQTPYTWHHIMKQQNKHNTPWRVIFCKNLQKQWDSHHPSEGKPEPLYTYASKIMFHKQNNFLQVLRFSQLYGLRFCSSGMLLCHWVISNPRTTIPLKMRPLCSFEILWTNYPVMQCHIWGEQNPQNNSFAAQIYNVDFPHPTHKSHLKIKEKHLSSSFWKTYSHSDDQDVWNVSFFLMRTFARHFKIFSSMNGFIARIFQTWISLTL